VWTDHVTDHVDHVWTVTDHVTDHVDHVWTDHVMTKLCCVTANWLSCERLCFVSTIRGLRLTITYVWLWFVFIDIFYNCWWNTLPVPVRLHFDWDSTHLFHFQFHFHVPVSILWRANSNKIRLVHNNNMYSNNEWLR
jgi:hypothetical protein